LSCRDTLGQLNKAANLGPVRHCVLGGAGLDADDADTWVLWAAIVRAITKITKPGLQPRGVVLLDNSAVSLDSGMTRDGRPLAGAGNETNVDRRILLEVVGLARLGVGVEEEIKAVSFLLSVS
jgi:hypothetical protein